MPVTERQALINFISVCHDKLDMQGAVQAAETRLQALNNESLRLEGVNRHAAASKLAKLQSLPDCLERDDLESHIITLIVRGMSPRFDNNG